MSDNVENINLEDAPIDASVKNNTNEDNDIHLQVDVTNHDLKNNNLVKVNYIATRYFIIANVVTFLPENNVQDMNEFKNFKYDGFKWDKDHFVKEIK